MKQNIRVECLVDRSWNPASLAWVGNTVSGALIDIATQSAEDNFGKLIPVGIVLLETGALESVPLEFITQANQAD